MTDDPNQTILHGSAVAVDGAGCLILGASGSGKSTLALMLMGLGADLVADDRVLIIAKSGELSLDAPQTLPPAIEARGVGLLNASLIGQTPLRLVIDLDRLETERLPHPKSYELLGQSVPCLHKADTPHFPFALIHYLRFGLAPL